MVERRQYMQVSGAVRLQEKGGEMARIWSHLLMAAAAVMVSLGCVAAANYGDALSKSVLFFEGQRSGKLPSSQRMTWRKDSALSDGHDARVDLVGGYYDAGDNVKFGFPMAFTTTVLAWSIIEFGNCMGNEDRQHAMDAVRWATDYLLKATANPNKVYVQVGNPNTDHNCWERPEDMDTTRDVYFVDAEKPGSEVAAETAAALSASSIIFKQSDPAYAQLLLQRSMQVFHFAFEHQGSYNDSLGNAVCPFYCDFSGYKDELVWGAAWINKASGNQWYWNYVTGNINTLPWTVGEFGWDNKHGGIAVLLYREFLQAKNDNSRRAGEFACSVLPESPTRAVKYSPGGLLFKVGEGNMQHATALSFLLLVFGSYLNQVNQIVQCDGGVSAPPSRLIEVAKGQVDYILGNNPLKMSYMVGYGNKFPQRIHHRGSSLPSLNQHPGCIACKDGSLYYQSKGPNPNILTGAIVGGPNELDAFADDRELPSQSEPITYTNAPLVGLLAYFNAHG